MEKYHFISMYDGMVDALVVLPSTNVTVAMLDSVYPSWACGVENLENPTQEKKQEIVDELVESGSWSQLSPDYDLVIWFGLAYNTTQHK